MPGLQLGLGFGHPFTRDIAKETVPEEKWVHPSFRRTNILMTGLWVGIFLIMTISYVVSLPLLAEALFLPNAFPQRFKDSLLNTLT